MNISRLSTFSLGVAIGMLALAYANPSSAGGKNCDPAGDNRPKCQTDPPASGLTYRVQMDGAFVMDQLTTADGNYLNGEMEFTINRPGYDGDTEVGIACTEMTLGSDERNACETWGHVWNVCEIYNIWGIDPYGPNHITTTPNRKGKVQWSVSRPGAGIRAFFVTSIQSPIDLSNPLEVTLRLDSRCYYHADHKDDFPNRTLCEEQFLPEVKGDTTTFEMIHFSNHARGEKNVAHAQTCHAKEGELLPSYSTLTITAE